MPFVLISLDEKFPKALCPLRFLCPLCLNSTGAMGAIARARFFEATDLLGNPEREKYRAVACADGGWGIGRAHFR